MLYAGDHVFCLLQLRFHAERRGAEGRMRGKKEAGAGARDHCHLRSGCRLSVFLRDSDRLPVPAAGGAPGGAVLRLLCQTGLFPAARGLRDQSCHRPDLSFLLSGKPGAEGDPCRDLPVYLLHGGLQRLADASVYRRLPSDLPAGAGALGACGDRRASGGNPVQHLPA